MAQQTAVEWLEQKLKNRYSLIHSQPFFEQAKQMEKEQKDRTTLEEVWNASIEYDNSTMQETPMVHFQQGAFWYRDQLKKP